MDQVQSVYRYPVALNQTKFFTLPINKEARFLILPQMIHRARLQLIQFQIVNLSAVHLQLLV